MKLSTKGRYAMRIIVRLAMLSHTGRIPNKQEIARAEAISADYVEQILMTLKAADLVRSHRGAKGGFSLARDPALITAADVVEAVEGPLDLAPCLHDECNQLQGCVTRGLWTRTRDALARVLGETTVGDMARDGLEMEKARTPSFVI